MREREKEIIRGPMLINIVFYRFPEDEEKGSKWLQAISRNTVPRNDSNIDTIRDKFTNTETYMKSLTVNDQLIIHSSYKTGFTEQ